MERRKFLIGTGALASGSAAAVGTGAFSSVQANRTVDVTTSEDANALLAFNAGADNANSEYASTDGGVISIDLGGLDGTDQGSGVNQDATTEIFDIFTITNQGTQEAIVYAQPGPLKDSDAFDDSVDNVYLDPQFSDMPNDSDSSLGERPDGKTVGSLTGIGGSVEDFETDLFEDNSEVPYSPETFLLGPGESFDFGLYIRTTGPVSDEFDFTVVIEADAELADQIESSS